MQLAGPRRRPWRLALLALLAALPEAAKHSLQAVAGEGVGGGSEAAFAMESKLLDIAVKHPALADLSSLAITTALHVGKDPTKAEEALQQMESLLLRSVQQKAAGDDTFDEAVQEIARIVEDSMKTTIKSQLDSEQQRLDDSYSAFEKCDSDLQATYGNATEMNETLPNASAVHRRCRFEENSYALAANDCQRILSEYETAYGVAKLDCDRLEEYPLRGRELCNNRIGDAGEHYLNLYEYWDQYLSWYDGNMSICRTLKWKVDNMTANCSNLSALHTHKRQECNNDQAKLDTNSCGLVKRSESGCEKYSTCYASCLSNFHSVNQSIAAQERQLKQEWRAVLRIECLLDALQSENVTEELNICIGKTHNLDEISINYTAAPSPTNEESPYTTICTNLTAYVPITSKFFDRHFKDLPPDAPAELRWVKFCPSTSGGTMVSYKSEHGRATCQQNRTVIPTASMVSYSSEGIHHADPGIGGANSWAPAKAEAGQSMTVDLGQEETVVGTFVQGGSSGGRCIDSWVTTYTILYSTDNIHYEHVPEARRGSHDCSTKVGSSVQPHLQARFVRFGIETWHGWASMRVGILVC